MEQPRELELWRYLQSQRDLAARLIEGESLDRVAPNFLVSVGGAPATGRRARSGRWPRPLRHAALRLRVERARTSTPSRSGGAAASCVLARRRVAGGRLGDRRDRLGPRLQREPDVPAARESRPSWGWSAALAIPVPIGAPEEVLAVAEFHTRSFNAQSQELMALLAGFADQLGDLHFPAPGGGEDRRSRATAASTLPRWCGAPRTPCSARTSRESSPAGTRPPSGSTATAA